MLNQLIQMCGKILMNASIKFPLRCRIKKISLCQPSPYGSRRSGLNVAVRSGNTLSTNHVSAIRVAEISPGTDFLSQHN